MASPLDEIINGQAEWATRHGILFDSSYRCRTVADNLFVRLSCETSDEFRDGAGSELGTVDAVGSMASLRSSSALAVNVFEPWRAADIAPLGALLGVDRSAQWVRFEVRYPTGLGGLPPHLDVVIGSHEAGPVAIESKFTETYTPAHNGFRPSYFESASLWDGFEQTRRLALEIAAGTEGFRYLGAAQLIKHALGLKYAYGPQGFRLVYLWYEWPSEIADLHNDEVNRFSEMIGSEFDFVALTYQRLFDDLSGIPEPQMGHAAYLRDRYFSTSEAAARMHSP